MDSHLKYDLPKAIDDKDPIDPLRRGYVPREARTPRGTVVFRTFDDKVYARLKDGSIRRAHAKVNGKLARRMRAKARKVSL